MKDKFTIGINAKIFTEGDGGGVEQVFIGLAHALGKLEDGEEEYIILSHPRNPDWLRPYIARNMQIIPRPWKNRKEWASATVINPFKQIIKLVAKPLLKPLIEHIYARRKLQAVQSDGCFKSLGINVVHFPSQDFVLTGLPSIYNPHDLQHLHFPEFFTSRQIHAREVIYRAGCHHANAVAVHSKWVKDDIIRHYGTEPEKIFVIPWGSPMDAYESVSKEALSYVQEKFKLPQNFAFYPAQTWPHKNHIRLLEAIALVRKQQGLVVNLICTGKKNDFWPNIARHMAKLHLEDQVKFLGFVNPSELRALYQLSQFVVIPTLFEAGSFPMFEAWSEGTPVACSTVTSLPEDAGDSALFFNPTSVEEIAGAIYQMATNAKLRETLRERGTDRIKQFTWERTAKTYRALYRKLGGCTLTEEDEILLDAALGTRRCLRMESI